MEIFKIEPEPKKDELLILWHKQCLQTRSGERKKLKSSKREMGDSKDFIKLDLERIPNLYHPPAPTGRMALWCPPLGFTSPHFIESPKSSRRSTAPQTARSWDESPRAMSPRYSIPTTSRADTLLSTKEACWAESLRSTPAIGGTSSNFLRALALPSRLRPRPADSASPRARREELMELLARVGNAVGSLSALDPSAPPLAAPGFSQTERLLDRVMGRIAPPPPPMVFKRPRPALLDESLSPMDITRDWYFQQQELRAQRRLSWTRRDR
jgi:hypothetical protein